MCSAGHYQYLSLGRAIFDGIVQQIAEDLLQTVEISDNRQRRFRVHFKVYSFFLRRRSEDIPGMLKEFLHIHALAVDFKLAGLHAGQLEQFIDLFPHPL